ncbi:MAG: protein kinase [Bryobacterales bacterium]|nr:protein kinase [Bryobacterales bacterium]
MALHRIGNYELLGELGRGGMGVVYRGVDSFIKRQVAIKTIYLSEIQEEQERQFLRERLYREAQSAGILSHPNIVTIYQIGEQDEITYIAMEFVDGHNLAEVLRKRDQAQVTLDLLASVFSGPVFPGRGDV